MKDLDERLAGHLQAQADQLRFSTAHVDRVIARGRRRQRRARVAASSLAALSVVAAVVGFQATRLDAPTRVKVSGDDPSASSVPVSVALDGATTTISGSTATSIPGTVAASNGVTLGGTGSAPLPQATVGGANISWQRKSPKSSVGGFNYYNNPPVQQGNRLVVLSTAPAGSASASRFPGLPDTLYTTTDGVEWTPASLGAEKWISQIAGTADRLYAVGTAPATVATQLNVNEGDAIAATSTDGGRTWTPVAIPLDTTTGIIKGTRSVSSAVSLAAGGKGAIVTVSSFRQPFIADLVTTGVDTSWGVSTSPAGVSVLARPPSGQPDPKVCSGDLPRLRNVSDLASTFGAGAEASIAQQGLSPWVCTGADPANGYQILPYDKLGYPVAKSYSWSELGTTWEELARGQQSTATFYSADGATYEPVKVPASSLDQGGGGPNVIGDADGFLVAAYRQTSVTDTTVQMSMQTFRSTDGRSWTAGQVIEGVGCCGQSPARMADGRWVMFNQGPSPVLLTSDDGLTWQALGLADVVAKAVGPTRQGGIGAVDVGPAGIAIAVGANPDPVAERGGVAVTDRGVTLTISNSNRGATITDATGAVLGTTASLGMNDSAVLRIENNGPGGANGTASPATTAEAAPATSAATPLTTAGAPTVAPCVPDRCDYRSVGPPVYVVLDPVTGAERARFTSDAIEAAMAAVNENPTTYDPRALILTSADGVTWAVTDASEVAGEPISQIFAIDHFGDKVIARATTKRALAPLDPQTGFQPFVQLALVGTFTG